MAGEREQFAAGLLPDESDHSELLATVVEVARGIFSARAASVMMHDAEAGELVFKAVAGEGEETLVGSRIPADTGIAGWVLTSQEPLVIEDVERDPRFARDVAEKTGYVPRGLMAVPLMRGEEAIGVLSVLDRPADSRFTVAEMDLLGLFATQAAVALDLLRRSQAAREVLGAGTEPAAGLASLAAALEQQPDRERREAALRLLDALEELLRGV